MSWFFWLFRCWWAGHNDFHGLNKSIEWAYRQYEMTIRQYEVTRCIYCNKVLKAVPLISGRRHMRVQVEILEDGPDDMSVV